MTNVYFILLLYRKNGELIVIVLCLSAEEERRRGDERASGPEARGLRASARSVGLARSRGLNWHAELAARLGFNLLG